MLETKNILLIITGGIAAYKSLDLIRRLREKGAVIRPVLTKSAAEFVTPLSVSALSESKVYGDLFSLTDEHEMGHIRLAREADLILVCPASADFITKMRRGIANDLASTLMMAADTKVLVAPAMNVKMWENPATQENVNILKSRGVHFIGPAAGDMACGETGEGRLEEIDQIVAKCEALLNPSEKLKDKHILITAGPTHEAIDPVRYLANHSSGKQGHALASACVDAGMKVTLVMGPSHVPDVPGAEMVRVTSAREMHQVCLERLPADIVVCCAAVADWRPEVLSDQKVKKQDGTETWDVRFVKNPDILADISNHQDRPKIVIGFAAETDKVIENATAKRQKKNCDALLVNEVTDAHNPFGNDQNKLHWITEKDSESWNMMPKQEIALNIVQKLEEMF